SRRRCVRILAAAGFLICMFAAPPAPKPAGSVELQMKNVNFRLAEDIVLEVRTLRGRLQRTNPEVPVTFDDSGSFNVEIDSGQVAIAPASLTALMSSYVLAYPGAPIKNVSMEIHGNKLVQRGTLHKGVDIPFKIEGSLSATEEGDIRLHADQIRSAHLPMKGLLHLFGEDLSKLVNQNAGRGMKIVGDDIILIPRALTPPPHLDGRVTQVSIAGGKIVQVFDSGRREPALNPPLRAASYIYHRGGVLRFGKLTMNDADLELVSDHPGVFDFFQREYRKQLVGGYSKNTPANGLVAHMLDYSRVASKATLAASSPRSASNTQR
ncbi:MAG TPA: hypothetical protein VGV35_21020, partial [Bryobacteraceae bacterium]|nr:hypothetical protein [Bryobacteraceae bacterium]